MNRELFLKEMGNFYDECMKAGISPFDMPAIASDLRSKIPDAEANAIIEEKIRQIGFKQIEHNHHLGSYEVLARFDDSGDYPTFRIRIEEANPFEVKVTMIDSYNNPKADMAYDFDCGKYYLDEEELEALLEEENPEELTEERKLEFHRMALAENDMWEPINWSEDTFICENSEDIWRGIQRIVDMRFTEWKETPNHPFGPYGEEPMM